jgi:hypothetical protein
MLIQEFIEQIIKWGSTHFLLTIIDGYSDVTFLNDQGHQTLIVHEQRGYLHGVKDTREMEFTMHHLAGIKIRQFLVLYDLQIEFTAI